MKKLFLILLFLILPSIVYSQIYVQTVKVVYSTTTGKATFTRVDTFQIGTSTATGDIYVYLLGTGTVRAKEGVFEYLFGDGSNITGVTGAVDNECRISTGNINAYLYAVGKSTNDLVGLKTYVYEIGESTNDLVGLKTYVYEIGKSTDDLVGLKDYTYAIGKSTEGLGGGVSSGTVTLLIAADDATAHTKTVANYICDGVADHSEIQTAIDSLSSTGGRVVLSEGEFITDAPIWMRHNSIHLDGMGIGVTVIKASNTTSIGALYGMIFSTNVTDIQISNMTVDGNKDNNTTAYYGIETSKTSQFIIQSVKVQNFDSHGLCNNWNFSGGDSQCNQGIITNCIFQDVNYGFYVFQYSTVTISNCVFNRMSSGFLIDAWYNCSIINVVINSVSSIGIYANSCYYNTICGNNIAVMSGGGGIRFDAATDYNAISNNVITSAVIGIKIESGCDHNCLVGNVVTNSTTGIQFDATSSSSTVTGNHSVGNTTDFVNNGTDVTGAGNSWD